MAEGIKERRFSYRLRTKTPIRYQIRGKAECNNSLTNDLSISGINFTVEKFIAPKTTIDLSFSLFSQVLNPTGMVAWAIPLPYSDKYKIGIKFLEFNQLQRNHLKDYLKMKSERKLK